MIPHTSCTPRAARSRLLGASLAALLAFPAGLLAQAADATQKKDETLQLQAFEVTGSRVKRMDTEGPAPVVTLSRGDLDLSGYITAGDFVRNLPMNTGGNIDPARTSTFATGASTANLRGLGSNNTLVLINGRRIASYGLPGGNGFNSVFDLNAIPSTAIESIELLKDGASAIYGSDAVAGVINVKLRKNFTGLSSDLYFGNTTDTDSFMRRISFTAGASTDKTQVVVNADYSKRNALKMNDRAWTRNADHRAYGGTDGRSSATFPGRATVPGLGTVTFNAPDATPTLAEAVPYVGFTHNYNFSPITDLIPQRTAYGYYVWAKHQFNENLYAFAELMSRSNRSNIEVAAVPIFGQNEQGTSPIGQMMLPATNPFNPFGVNISGAALGFRLVELGPRTTDIQSDATRNLIGIGGNLNADWSWEIAVIDAKNRTTQTNFNQSFDRLVQNALNGIRGPQSGRDLWLNPFGPNDPEVLAYLRSNFNRLSSFTTQVGDAQISGQLFDLPAGRVGVAAGLEHRTERLASWRSADEQAGQVAGGSEGLNTFGKRSVDAVYAESVVPVTKEIEMQFAVRHEDYSDFGKTTKPKAAIGYRPLPWLLVRGSFSQSFKAPDLGQLYNGGNVAFSSGNVVDPRRPTAPAQQLKIVTVGNPLLQPEETNTYYGGIVFEPGKHVLGGLLDGFSLNFDYFEFAGENVITTIGAGNILFGELDDPVLFGSRVIRAAATAEDVALGRPGALLFVNDSFLNLNTQLYRGWDLGLRYDWRTQNWGRFSATADVTYTHNLKFNDIEFIGRFAQPRMRANARILWSKGDWGVSVFADFIKGYIDQGNAAVGTGGDGRRHYFEDHITYNPQVSYRGFRNFTVSVGATNALDTPPPQSYILSEGYDNLTHNGDGRFVWMRISREF